ncbi:Protein of unknown function [Pyronema omphalodes CBS 100304]|uniref:Uncharacterized protein n=1 Tax=Pyronema omphalodes (strain CBS 100304) TaxID=1076935 RepID=U4LKB3_PYROM|nr:Protein of unknown function [Pyronema omphalodes CBS 100304]
MRPGIQARNLSHLDTLKLGMLLKSEFMNILRSVSSRWLYSTNISKS